MRERLASIFTGELERINTKCPLCSRYGPGFDSGGCCVKASTRSALLALKSEWLKLLIACLEGVRG